MSVAEPNTTELPFETIQDITKAADFTAQLVKRGIVFTSLVMVSERGSKFVITYTGGF